MCEPLNLISVYCLKVVSALFSFHPQIVFQFLSKIFGTRISLPLSMATVITATAVKRQELDFDTWSWYRCQPTWDCRDPHDSSAEASYIAALGLAQAAGCDSDILPCNLEMFPAALYLPCPECWARTALTTTVRHEVVCQLLKVLFAKPYWLAQYCCQQNH